MPARRPSSPKPSPVSTIPDGRRRVAVVGSGVAGLSAAHLLARKCDVSIFEREATVGMDAHSLDSHGARMDIPLRVFSESYYPNLTNLYKLVGVKYRIADYSFCCVGGAFKDRAAAYFRYVNVFVRGMALPLPALFHARQLAKCARLAYSFAHFLKHTPSHLEADPEGSAAMSIGEFLAHHGYSKEFARDLLYPMLSVVCTCSYAAVDAYPAPIIVDYFCNKYGLSGAQCRAYEGTRDVVARLTAPVSRVVTSATIVRVEAAGAGKPAAGKQLPSSQCKLIWRDGTTGHEHTECFDEVVLAMQANASHKVLVTPHTIQSESLAQVPHERKRVVLHTDDSVMPRNRSDWSPLNIFVDPNADAASVTVWMNQIDSGLRNELTSTVFQTWNPIVEPKKSTVLADYAFERPVVTAASMRAISRLQEAQGHGHVWFVGAYSRYSMPLLENGVKSAMAVARALGVDTSDVEFDEEANRLTKGSATLPSVLASLLLLALVVALTVLHAVYYSE